LTGLLLRAGFPATGNGDLGAVRLVGTHLGWLDCSGARLANTSRPALAGDSLEVDRNIILYAGFTAIGAGPAVIGLSGARIGGELLLDTSQVSRTRNDGHALADLDGTTYTGLPRPRALDHWLRLFEDHSPAYAAQPYQQLAAMHRAAGHDREVRIILMAQNRDQIARTGVRGWDRSWARLTGLTLGYGYQPWRALLPVARRAYPLRDRGHHRWPTWRPRPYQPHLSSIRWDATGRVQPVCAMSSASRSDGFM
jgi:hypothetical protein